jgi:hypothetical protein
MFPDYKYKDVPFNFFFLFSNIYFKWERGLANSLWKHVLQILFGVKNFQDILPTVKVPIFYLLLKINSYFQGTFLYVQY